MSTDCRPARPAYLEVEASKVRIHWRFLRVRLGGSRSVSREAERRQQGQLWRGTILGPPKTEALTVVLTIVKKPHRSSQLMWYFEMINCLSLTA